MLIFLIKLFWFSGALATFSFYLVALAANLIIAMSLKATFMHDIKDILGGNHWYVKHFMLFKSRPDLNDGLLCLFLAFLASILVWPFLWMLLIGSFLVDFCETYLSMPVIVSDYIKKILGV